MPTPRAGYFTKDGTKVPSVTTVLGQFKNPGPLMYWAWEQGKAGRDFREIRNIAADAGTLAHALVEANLKQLLPPKEYAEATQEVQDKAWQGYNNFLRWQQMTGLEVVSLETPLVSEKYRYGGTPDAVLSIAGQKAIGDWKASNGLYPDYLCQVAAYRQLVEENTGETLTGGFHLVRFSKDFADFDHIWREELEDAWQMFLHLLEAYRLLKQVEKRLR